VHPLRQSDPQAKLRDDARQHPPRADWGIGTFERVNRSSVRPSTGVTGITNVDDLALYNSAQQSLPPAPQIDAFLPPTDGHHAAGHGLLRTAVDTQSLRDAFFGGRLDAPSPGPRRGSSARPRRYHQSRHRDQRADAKANRYEREHHVATTAHNELDALLTRNTHFERHCNRLQATKAACTAVRQRRGDSAVTGIRERTTCSFAKARAAACTREPIPAPEPQASRHAPRLRCGWIAQRPALVMAPAWLAAVLKSG